MSPIQLRSITRFIRKFFAGFISVIPFTNTRLKNYPFANPAGALEKDWLDIGDDIENIKNLKK